MRKLVTRTLGLMIYKYNDRSVKFSCDPGKLQWKLAIDECYQ